MRLSLLLPVVEAVHHGNLKYKYELYFPGARLKQFYGENCEEYMGNLNSNNQHKQ